MLTRLVELKNLYVVWNTKKKKILWGFPDFVNQK
jgi:hypothetical protein